MKNRAWLLVVPWCLFSTHSLADESWTEIGGYVFASQISGESQISDITTDVDVSFIDILKNLDIGAMGFIEHRRSKWSFIGDVGHMTLSSDATATNGVLTVQLDAEVKQTTVQAFAGYRAFEQDYGDASFGLDVLGGVRYVYLEANIGIEAVALGLVTAASRSRNEDWADGVVGLRAQYNNNNGWGASFQADIGKGSDSNSYQLIGLVNYDFGNDWKAFGGYQFLNLDYEEGAGATRFGVDLNYYGPRFGVSYRF